MKLTSKKMMFAVKLGGFYSKKRNPEQVIRIGRKYARNRSEHCNHSTLTRMYDQIEAGLLRSQNAAKLDKPLHMGRYGKVVTEVFTFGLPVTCEYTRPLNVFYFDETGSNTHGKDDGNDAGEKMVVPLLSTTHPFQTPFSIHPNPKLVPSAFPLPSFQS